MLSVSLERSNQFGASREPAMRERAAMLLDAVGLGAKLHRPAQHMSGGEQQRVAIARPR